MIAAFSDLVRDARAATGVPGIAAGLLRGGTVELAADGVLEQGRDDRVHADTPFRIASISKPVTAALALARLELDDELRRLLSHTAGLRPESAAPLPEPAQGLFSYSNAGYWRVGDLCGRGMAESVLRPLGLSATGYDEPRAPARGHVQDGATGHRAVPNDVYPAQRWASGGLWSTTSDLLAFASAQMDVRDNPLFEPQVDALGARYALGWWVRGGVLDHEGSVAGYQSLLMIVPAQRLALAVLTNSWRGSGAIRRIVEALQLLGPGSNQVPAVSGLYALDGVSAVVEDGRITETETDPVTGATMTRRYRASADATLMSHRVDFPRDGVARIGWVALVRA
jgi:CubicO group peptidase (beta-lactamase class C family)